MGHGKEKSVTSRRDRVATQLKSLVTLFTFLLESTTWWSNNKGPLSKVYTLAVTRLVKVRFRFTFVRGLTLLKREKMNHAEGKSEVKPNLYDASHGESVNL